MATPKINRRAVIAGLPWAALGTSAAIARAHGQSTLFVNCRVVDGSGDPARDHDVRVIGDRISDVASLTPRARDLVIDCAGMVLAPGFIDTLSHHDENIWENRDATVAVAQGVTTIVVGQDGINELPLAELQMRMKRTPVALNIASFSGHGTLRRSLGADIERPAQRPEIERMISALRADMAQGALGLSTALEYEPGSWSDTRELIALARIAADANGRTCSHLRSEDRAIDAAIAELIEVARVAGLPAQVSHIKLAMRSAWGRSPKIIDTLNAARASGLEITADLYPYDYWMSNLTVLLPPGATNISAEIEKVFADVGSPEDFRLTFYNPEPALAGLTIADVAARWRVDPVEAYRRLVVASEAMRKSGNGRQTAGMTGKTISENDLRTFLAWPHTNICSDGTLVGPHPRGAGSFPRVFDRFVRKAPMFSLEAAIHRMTGLAARNIGLTDRGTIRPGAAADLVLLDPDVIADRATLLRPTTPAVGVLGVWINGTRVFRGNRSTGRRPGRYVKRHNTD
jgi:N-acyl-D-amino-acid deacylase